MRDYHSLSCTPSTSGEQFLASAARLLRSTPDGRESAASFQAALRSGGRRRGALPLPNTVLLSQAAGEQRLPPHLRHAHLPFSVQRGVSPVLKRDTRSPSPAVAFSQMPVWVPRVFFDGSIPQIRKIIHRRISISLRKRQYSERGARSPCLSDYTS